MSSSCLVRQSHIRPWSAQGARCPRPAFQASVNSTAPASTRRFPASRSSCLNSLPKISEGTASAHRLPETQPDAVSTSPPHHSVGLPSASLTLAVVSLLLVAGQASAAGNHDLLQQHVSLPTNPLFQLSEDTDFFSNVARYGRYFVTVMLGTGYVMLKPLRSALDKPVTAFFAIFGIVGGVIIVKLTLESMLGLGGSEPVVGASDFQRFTY